MKARELIKRTTEALSVLYGEREAAAIARLVAVKHYGVRTMDLAMNPDLRVEADENDFVEMVAQLAGGRPVQYVLGKADFYGLELEVGEGVLIPRPETEELVRWIATESRNARKLIDIGTGSGAIAIALAGELPDAEVTAMDVSRDALKFARRNNTACGGRVTIVEGDIFDRSFTRGRFDVVVSNPPYIPQSGRSEMRANVTDHEPHSALFVPDEDPLVFYREIANFATEHLEKEGALYFEIYEKLGEEVCEMLRRTGFSAVELREDINRRPRMVRALKTR